MTSNRDHGSAEVINPDALAKLTRLGGVTLVRQMIDLFFEHATQYMATLHAADGQEHFADVERAAHSLKTSAGNLGAMRLLQVAAEIEAATATSETHRIEELIAECRAEFSRVSAGLADIRVNL